MKLVSRRSDGLYQVNLLDLTNGKCEQCVTKFSFKHYPYYIWPTLLSNITPYQCEYCHCIDRVKCDIAYQERQLLVKLREI